MIALIDYDAGNTCSVMNALRRIDADFVLTADPELIRSSERVIFPGVGHAGAAMRALERKGLVDVIRNLSQPVLGICVGMQLLLDSSEEGDVSCLGVVSGRVTKFIPGDGVKVPHMGWNQVVDSGGESLFRGINPGEYFYFVHSYYVPILQATIGTTSYSHAFSAAVRHSNFWGVQFHAEKSGSIGEQLIQNFITIETALT
ncbi:MAG: imidazole glycerol phosphate synthase subunit HisH [Bacteroidota bacterium]